MQDSILKLLNNNNESSLSFSTTLFQVENNDNNSLLTKKIDVIVNEPVNTNANFSMVNNTIPTVSLTNQLMTNKQLTDATTGLLTADQMAIKLRQQETTKRFYQNLYLRKKYSVSDIINNGCIFLAMEKPTGFNEAIRDAINSGGSFDLIDKDNNLLYSTTEISRCLYNTEVKNYILSNFNNEISGIQQLNVAMMTGSNKIPIKITNDIINTIDSYGVNTFIVEIPLANNANLLNSMIEETSLAEKTTLYNKEYVFNFGFYFEIEYIDKFPVNFIQYEKSTSKLTNSKLVNNASKYKIAITSGDVESFYNNCIDNIFKKLYLIFI